jgi:Protein of unknown function (DUF3054)
VGAVAVLLPPESRRVALVDALGIVGFTLIGMLSHGVGIGGAGLLRDTVPLLGGWTVAALLFRLYGRPTIARLAATWAVGITGGVLVRALALGRDLDGRQAAFLVTTLVFCALVLGGARLAMARAGTRPPAREGGPRG